MHRRGAEQDLRHAMVLEPSAGKTRIEALRVVTARGPFVVMIRGRAENFHLPVLRIGILRVIKPSAAGD
jgi:hypothetical protein